MAAGEVTALARVDSPGSAPLAALEAAGAGRRTMLRDELHAQLIGPPPRFVLISTAGALPCSTDLLPRMTPVQLGHALCLSASQARHSLFA